MNFDRLLSAIQGMMQTYYKRGFKNGYYDAKCLSHIIRFRIMITSLLEGHSFKEAMTLNDIDSLFLKQIKSYEIQYTYQQAFDIAIEEIKKVKEMINKYRSSHDSVINLKAKDDLSYIIENIIKKAIYKDKIK
ncbi:MAG: hypothetical protein LUG60_08525 [Erysipelotrichaceae bacterium]|nr:hypothetical protein [Erysipelotrichaceae bacterium]